MIDSPARLRVVRREGVSHAAFFRTGWRGAGPDRLPLGRPGDRPHGFGGLAGVPTTGSKMETARRTRDGVSVSGANGRSHGRRRSAIHGRASCNWV